MSAIANPPLLIDRWNVQGQTVSLYAQDNALSYSVGAEEAQPIAPHLYSSVGYTRAMTNLFHDLIQENLNTSVTSSSFLPVFISQAHSSEDERPLDYTVALFGREDLDTQEIIGAKWGIFNAVDATTTSLNAPIDGAVGQCLQRVLWLEQSTKLYADGSQAIADLDATGRIASIALKVLRNQSIYTPNIPLTEDLWAVTLISSPQKCSKVKQQESSTGHALIAYEGIEHGYSFLRYAHLINKGEKPGLGRVEILTKRVNDAVHGPTWSVLKNAVLEMEYIIRRYEKVPFVRGAQAAINAREVSATLLPPLAGLASAVGALGLPGFICVTIGALLLGTAKTSEDRLYDCLRWAIKQLRDTHIHFDLPPSCVTPDQAVAYLNQHPESVHIIHNFPPRLLTKPSGDWTVPRHLLC